MTSSQKLRVFVSSPSDVRPERLVVERVVAKLAREFAHFLLLEAVLWEREPLTVDAHFQDGIIAPRETDIVVVVLWSRLGVPLPQDRFKGAMTGGSVTGTEWEFEDALAARRKSGEGLPDLLLYRKTAPVIVSLSDRSGVAEAQAQADLVESFMQRWTRDAADQSFSAAFSTFEDPAEFEEKVEAHLRALLRRRLGSDDRRAEGEISWYRGCPWRGLGAFEVEDAPVFHGRSRARNALRELLAVRVARGRPFILVLGASGSGKSSLARAGLLADIRCPGMIDRTGLVRWAAMKPSDGGPDLFAALAGAILADTALPELSQPAIGCDTETLRRLLRAGEAQVLVRQALAAAGQAAGVVPGAETRLALLIDQMEEIYTNEAIGTGEREAFLAAIDGLCRSGLVWVVATMRSDFFDRLEKTPALAALSEDGRYLLVPPSQAEMGQILRGPAQAAGLRFETDPESGEKLDEAILAATDAAPMALPLLSFVLEQLWNRRSARGILTFEAYRDLGGLEGALGRYAESVLADLPADAAAAFPAVLRALVTVGQGADGRATSRPVPLSRFEDDPASAALVGVLVRKRLLSASGDGDGAVVRISHEALLSHWPKASTQIEADRDDLQRRARIEAAAAAWEAAGRPGDMLLSPGLPLTEAESLLARRGGELDRSTVALIERSRRRRNRRLILGGAAASALLTTLGVGGAYLQQSSKAVALMEARRAAASRALAGTLTAYAGSAGETVSDGEDGHGLYTGALLKEIVKEDLSLTEAILAAHDTVRKATGRQQTPQINTSLNGDLFLAAPPAGMQAHALVVGANDYRFLPKLLNPINDANGIAEALARFGYEVTVLRDPTRAALAEAAEGLLSSFEAQKPRAARIIPRQQRAGRGGVSVPTAGFAQAASISIIDGKGEKAPATVPPPAGGPATVPLARSGPPVPNSLAVVYFAGLGIEFRGRGLFPAIDDRGDAIADVDGIWFDVSAFVSRLERAAAARIVILDFCRDNPFERPSR